MRHEDRENLFNEFIAELKAMEDAARVSNDKNDEQVHSPLLKKNIVNVFLYCCIRVSSIPKRYVGRSVTLQFHLLS